MDLLRRRRAADVESILRAAIVAADPAPAVDAAVARRSGFAEAHRVHVVAIGKAAVRMYDAARTALRRPPATALVVAPRTGGAHEMLDARLITASHPVPDHSSLRAGRAVADALQTAQRDDIVLVLLSGGASSLCVLPANGVTLDDYAHIVQSLLQAGADIHELNAVRRQIDALKGGGMAALAAPARSIALIVSDVPGDDIATIASGPLTPSPTGPADAREVLDRYGIGADVIDQVAAAKLPPDVFDRVSAEIILDNADARRGAAGHAEQLGYRVRLVEELVTGEARVAAQRLVARLMEEDESANVPTCLIAGGETTVTVRGDGKGGRNQEFVLAGSLLIPADSRIVIGSVGTDGVDGPTRAAGAVADCSTALRAAAAGMSAADALARNDSGSFFEHVGGEIRTGPTGTNVMDVIAAAYGPFNE